MRLVACFSLVIALVSPCFGLGVGLTEDQARENSDVIAHVVITATTPPPLAFGRVPADPVDGINQFRRIATARVLTAVKGCKPGDTLSLLFDNGYGCPNVIYSDKEECLVFLKKAATADLYTTMNLYAGRFSVKENQVEYFYLMGTSGQSPKALPLKTVIEWLTAPPSVPPTT